MVVSMVVFPSKFALILIFLLGFQLQQLGTSTEGEGVLQPHQVAIDKQELR